MRLIDADALIAEYDKVHVGTAGGARKLMEDAPTIKPESRWIPCSEHLPKKNGTYIVTEKVFSVDDYHHKGKYQIKVEPVDFFGGAFMRAPYFEVLAWMPLPAPFRTKEDES